jgi:heavy metal sensor kinase
MGASRAAWRGPGSLRVRLSLWYVLLLALILAGFCTFVYLRLARDLYAEADSLLVDEARGLATPLQSGDESNLSSLLSDVPAGTIAIVADMQTGRIFSSQSGSIQVANALRALPLTADAGTPVQSVALAGDPTWRLATLSTTGQGTQWIVRVARSDRDVQAALRQLLVQMALAVPAVLVVAVASGMFLAGRALDPIAAITRTADQIGVEDLGRRIGIHGRDEVGRLAATFDGMLNRLERAFVQQRQFTADASHELRTPLAMLMSQIDIALERNRTPDQYQQILRSLREDVADLSRLTSELLMLARAEAGQEPLATEHVRLTDLVSGVVTSMEPLASARQVRVVVEQRGHPVVDGDEARLMQLVINLLDNAIKYTPAGGTVTVTTRHDPGWALIEVEDTGPGIQPEQRERIFERFFRVDSARLRGGGSGLGLAISRWIAQAHGGDIQVRGGVAGGSTFCVRLPATEAAAVLTRAHSV